MKTAESQCHIIEASGLDPDVCRRARLARDVRFDGEFFLGVSSTGIYCRPVCPARAPAEKNVSYYRSAAQAAAAGYRPCLRCRPESAPHSPAWQGTATTVQRALRLIETGALNDSKLEELANRLGVGERYLRKLFERELGVSPLAVAQNQRLLFARKLLLETHLPITDVAHAAGFGSVRRFNSAVKASFRATPGELRSKYKGKGKTVTGRGISLRLQYRPPYDWPGVLDFFGRHAIAGMEQVEDGYYRKQIAIAGESAVIQVQPLPGKHALSLQLQLEDPAQLMPVVNRVRQMFDLDANPAEIGAVLSQDSALSSLLKDCPGVRSPRQWSLYEAAFRAVVGQQVSIVAARSVASRLLAASGSKQLDPAAIARLPDAELAMPGRRRDTLREVSALFKQEGAQVDTADLAAIKGVGPWTLALYALRGQGDPDSFPQGDLGLVKAWQKLPGAQGDIADAIDRWRPWSAYAANLLWRSLSS
jgi:AraC family transcriptional regulator of adaptative response / DNA-3-methyladenine glycosylase II